MVYDRVWYCTCCGNKIPYIIPRKNGRLHPVSHLKKLWCPFCGVEKNAAETDDMTKYSSEDFKFEYTYGNFSPEGERILPYGKFREKMHKEGIELP